MESEKEYASEDLSCADRKSLSVQKYVRLGVTSRSTQTEYYRSVSADYHAPYYGCIIQCYAYQSLLIVNALSYHA